MESDDAGGLFPSHASLSKVMGKDCRQQKKKLEKIFKKIPQEGGGKLAYLQKGFTISNVREYSERVLFK